MINLSFKGIMLILIIINLSACRTINMKRAEKLSNSGVESAYTISEAYHKSAESLASQIESQKLLYSLNKDKYKLNQKSISAINEMQRELLYREEVFKALARAYSAFSALVIYDDHEQMESELLNLHTAVDDYALLIDNKNAPLPQDFNLRLSMGPDFYLGNHKRRIKKASKLMRQELKLIGNSLQLHADDFKTQQIQNEVLRQRLATAKTMYKTGVGDAKTIFNQLVNNYGLNVNNEIINQREDARIAPMVEQIIESKHMRDTRAMNESYSAAIDTVNTLNMAHLKLEKGKYNAFAGKLFLRIIRSYIGVASYVNSTG